MLNYESQFWRDRVFRFVSAGAILYFVLPIIQKQLAKAGIRVAWTLNEIFR